jgi:hypothetical protein
MAKRPKAKKTHRTSARRLARPSTHRTGSARGSARTGRKWSQHVTEQSNALDLEPGVFKLRSAKGIAASLKRRRT